MTVDWSHQLVENNARQAAILMVHRLAPEARIYEDTLIVGDYRFRAGSVIGGHGSGYCCVYTFAFVRSEQLPPRLEQALTIYLYWKLFRVRFEKRLAKVIYVSFDR